jgi:hypothetical protein
MRWRSRVDGESGAPAVDWQKKWRPALLLRRRSQWRKQQVAVEVEAAVAGARLEASNGGGGSGT